MGANEERDMQRAKLDMVFTTLASKAVTQIRTCRRPAIVLAGCPTASRTDEAYSVLAGQALCRCPAR